MTPRSESDPESVETTVQTAPVPVTFPAQPAVPVRRCIPFQTPPFTLSAGGTTYTAYDRYTCTRRMVVEQGFAPAGFRVNLLPRHRLQLTFSTIGGYMFSSQQVPVTNAGSFNFTFDFGAGLEYYRTRGQSIRLEYVVQHYSDKDSSDLNPGVDSGFVKLTYAFGR